MSKVALSVHLALGLYSIMSISLLVDLEIFAHHESLRFWQAQKIHQYIWPQKYLTQALALINQ